MTAQHYDVYDFIDSDGIRYCAGTCVSSYVWVTRDGRRLHVTEMSDDHLRNTILMLQRKFAVFGEEIPITAAMKIQELKGVLATRQAPRIERDEREHTKVEPGVRRGVWWVLRRPRPTDDGIPAELALNERMQRGDR